MERKLTSGFGRTEFGLAGVAGFGGAEVQAGSRLAKNVDGGQRAKPLRVRRACSRNCWRKGTEKNGWLWRSGSVRL
ncbi:hypothetical protein [Paenibacillus sp. P22]|uniref:hypothetical protein n=1 Tax=Paenibacillus sp. P22 TaxID=483908 RepID=UPI000436C5EA|nr:hypothetical protein [Paenibacillus sp. P22]CDN45860.1 hypothetical protein BN871_JI_00020 [Paenibacillus sp. P22]